MLRDAAVKKARLCQKSAIKTTLFHALDNADIKTITVKFQSPFELA